MIFLLLPLALASTITTISITPSSYNIYTTTTYSINLNSLTTIPSGGYISIIFPSMFTTLSSGSVTCSSSQKSECLCSLSSNTLNVSSCFPLTPSTFKLTLYNISNPIYSKTSTPFQIYTFSNTNSVLDLQTSGPKITFRSFTLGNASISTKGNVGDYSN